MAQVKAVKTPSSSLGAAKAARDDEFYTPRETIEDELRHYKPHFAGKSVFCNCDDPEKSEFFLYFARNFCHLGLAKLVGTHYAPSKLFGDMPAHKVEPVMGEVNRTPTGRKGKTRITLLDGDGDFRSAECRALLDEADVVCTNPPFSLFREFIAAVRHKQFLVIGNINAICYKSIFPLIKNGDMWLGATKANARPFDRPKDPPAKLGIAYWFTNLSHRRRERDGQDGIILTEKYAGDKHPCYDNYPAIEVGKTKDIPYDYEGEMGVPVSFLEQHVPSQFEIVGRDEDLLNDGKGRFYVNGRRKYARIIIRHKGAKNEN